AGGAAEDHAVVAEDLVPDAGEDEGRARVVGVLGPPVVGRGVEALRDEAHAADRVRRPVVPPPQAAVLAGRRVVVLAGTLGPGAHAALGAAPLDQAGRRLRIGDAPVEAVAAEIHQAPAAVEIGLQRVEHLHGIVFRVAAGHHHAVVL